MLEALVSGVSCRWGPGKDQQCILAGRKQGVLGKALDLESRLIR